MVCGCCYGVYSSEEKSFERARSQSKKNTVTVVENHLRARERPQKNIAAVIENDLRGRGRDRTIPVIPYATPLVQSTAKPISVESFFLPYAWYAQIVEYNTGKNPSPERIWLGEIESQREKGLRATFSALKHRVKNASALSRNPPKYDRTWEV